jgi:hypothetical protein
MTTYMARGAKIETRMSFGSGAYAAPGTGLPRRNKRQLVMLIRSAAFADISSSFGLTSKYHTCTGRLFNVTNVNMDYKITSRSYFKRDLFL